MTTTHGSGPDDARGLELELDIWHPGCWTLHVTEDADADLLGHGVYETGETIQGLFTAVADTRADADALVAAIRDSPLTDRVVEMHGTDSPIADPTAGIVTRGLLVEWGVDRCAAITDALVSRGFLPRRTYRMTDGREQWNVVTTADRGTARRRLDAIRAETDADIAVRRISTHRQRPVGLHQPDALTPRQREVFELARRRGYYDWPRTVSAADLADELDVTRSTVVEHLRKAEARLFA